MKAEGSANKGLAAVAYPTFSDQSPSTQPRQFEKIWEALMPNKDGLSSNLSLTKIKNQEIQNLIGLQRSVTEHHLKVELVSRLAESGAASFRRLQSAT